MYMLYDHGEDFSFATNQTEGLINSSEKASSKPQRLKLIGKKTVVEEPTKVVDRLLRKIGQ